MVRTVRVDLEANVGRYTGPVEDAKVKTEELDRKVEGLDRDLNKVPPDAAKAAAALKLLGDETGKAGVKLDDLGKRSTSLGAIDDQITRTRGEVAKLADEFNRTGDAGILTRLFSSQNDLKALEKLKKDVSGALEQGAEDGGREGGKQFSAAMQGELSTPGLGPILTAVLVAAAVVAAPAVGGALMGAAGLGAIGLGIVGQLSDPQVHKAVAGLGADLTHTLSQDTQVFKEPLLQAIGEVDAALQKMIGKVDWKTASQDLEPLLRGLTGLVGNLLPGFNHLLQESGPILGALSNDLSDVGSGLGMMFDLISRGGKGGQEALRLLLSLVIGLAVSVGALILVLEKLTEWGVAATQRFGEFLQTIKTGVHTLDEFTAAVGRGFAGVARTLNGTNDSAVTFVKTLGDLGPNAQLSADDLKKLNAQLAETAVTTDTLAGKMVDLAFNKLIAVDHGVLGVAESLTKLSESFQQNGRSIDIHTAKGQANREAILAAVTANMQLYQAQIASGMSAIDAAHNYDDNTKALESQLKKAGLTKQQIDGLIGSYRQIPDKVNSIIAIQGLTDAINHLSDLLSMIYGINGKSFSFKVTENYVKQVSTTLDRLNPNGGVGNRWGGLYEHAADGLLRDAKVFTPAGPARYAFAEPSTGGEAFVPRFGDYQRSTGIIDTAARWYGGRFAPSGAAGGWPGINLNLTVHAGMGTDGAALGAQIAERLRPYINSLGGNVQQALGRRGQ